MRFSRGFCVLGLVAALTACGGGGGSGSSAGGGTTPAPGKDPARVSFAEMRDNANALVNPYLEEPRTAALPQGSATYNGYMIGARGYTIDQEERGSVNLGTDPEFASRVQLKADFDRQTMDGRFYQLTDSKNKPIRGELKLSNGKIEGSTFRAALAGQWDSSNVNGRTEGELFGQRAPVVIGAMEVADNRDQTLIRGGAFVATQK